jgi:hypothetical protein
MRDKGTDQSGELVAGNPIVDGERDIAPDY